MMYERASALRNAITGFCYRHVLKKIFFAIDPEDVHDNMIRMGRMLGGNLVTRSITSLVFGYRHTSLEQTILGIHFKNPVGLAAGFDKDAELTDIIPSVGFGFEEIGSVTGEPCEGNPKPRLWRLPKTRGLVVYYGLKSKGADAVSQTLKNKKFAIPIGTSVAKTNCQATVDIRAGIADYAKAFRAFSNIGDYFVINISCPNTFGGELFTDAGRLDMLLAEIDIIETTKPIFLKLAPDLSDAEIDTILETVSRHRVHGFVCTNLTKKREGLDLLDQCPPVGSVSGKAVEKLSNHTISRIYQRTEEKYVIIGCGGIFSAEDAYTKIKLGASLVQLITGMIFEGPQVISEINQGLVGLLQKDGYKNISKAVGRGSR